MKPIIPQKFKICSYCKLKKCTSEFYLRNKHQTRYSAYCKLCSSITKKKSSKPDSFIGTIHPKNSKMKVVGWDGVSKSGTAKKYDVYCAECAKDAELFKSAIFKQPKGEFIKGQIACGCAVSPRWSKEQYEILIKRKCKKLNYDFIGWNDTIYDNNSKIILKCNDHLSWDSTTINNFLNKPINCPLCSKNGFKSNKLGHLYVNVSDCGITKIGISHNNVENRLKQQIKSSGINFKTIYITVPLLAQNVYMLEQKIIKNLKNLGFDQPQKYFDGYTECFINVPFDLIAELIDHHCL